MKHFLLSLSLVFGLFGQLIAQGDARWVMAPSGLNLRATESPSSDKVTTVSFKEEVQLIAAGNGPKITVDHIQAGMAKVNYQSQTGYMFEGYLCQFPPPPSNSKTKFYVDELRKMGFDIPYEEHNYDYDGYFQYHEVFYLPKASWEEAYFIAQNLYRIPAGLKFPKPSKRKEESFTNPEKDKDIWTDALSVNRNDRGNLVELKYSHRAEGGGLFVTIEQDKEEPRMKITYGLIAD